MKMKNKMRSKRKWNNEGMKSNYK